MAPLGDHQRSHYTDLLVLTKVINGEISHCWYSNVNSTKGAQGNRRVGCLNKVRFNASDWWVLLNTVWLYSWVWRLSLGFRMWRCRALNRSVGVRHKRVVVKRRKLHFKSMMKATRVKPAGDKVIVRSVKSLSAVKWPVTSNAKPSEALINGNKLLNEFLICLFSCLFTP